MDSSTECVDAKDNFQLLQTDEEILLSILPSNIWAYTFQKLKEKHPPSLENVSNSSLYFRNLVLSKRVLYLFPQVFKLIGPEFANLKNSKTAGSNIIKSRIICKDWNKAVDTFIIDDTLEPDFFSSEPPQPSDHALMNARYQYFGEVAPTKLPRFLTSFQDTHLPQTSQNPFIGKVVYIDLTGYTDQTQWASIADQVSTLLRKYGHHIKILNIGLFKFQPDNDTQLRNQSWLLEWLENCPNLTHLKVGEQFYLSGEMDACFGYCPNPGRTMIRRLGLEMINPIMTARLQQATSYLSNLQQQLVDYIGLNDAERDDPNVMQRLTQAIEQHTNRFDHDERPVPQPVVLKFPTLKNLKCLKLCHLSALNFNSLLSANIHISWLQIESLGEEKYKYIDYYAMEFPNLRKFYIKLCSPGEVRKLSGVHQSWLSLTHLHFQYCTSKLCCLSPAFTEWVEIFEVISKNWENTLTDLKLKLPVAEMDFQKEKVVRDSTNCRLNLSTLKRLKIWLNDRSDVTVAKTDFLETIREGLEQLIIE